MTKTTVLPKKPKAERSIAEELAAAREKVRLLEERQRDQIRKEKERNYKSILELLKVHKLDTVAAEKWETALPGIKLLLLGEETGQPVSQSTAELHTDGMVPVHPS